MRIFGKVIKIEKKNKKAIVLTRQKGICICGLCQSGLETCSSPMFIEVQAYIPREFRDLRENDIVEIEIPHRSRIIQDTLIANLVPLTIMTAVLLLATAFSELTGTLPLLNPDGMEVFVIIAGFFILCRTSSVLPSFHKVFYIIAIDPLKDKEDSPFE